MNQEIFKNSVFSLKDEMFRFAKSFLVSSDEAQDLVQDMMLKFWQKKEELQTLSNIKSYVLDCGHNGHWEKPSICAEIINTELLHHLPKNLVF